MPSLRSLWLGFNQITDEGCAALASALRGGALPALTYFTTFLLKELSRWGIPASEEATEAMFGARAGLFDPCV